ncbi:MAG: hypothetical protein H6741_11955 [Alphaproteobacteria bacterium]|nr:hypothetical protein [Alphaproteobacteria bacterium]MCB9793426.1 hypothetical protein [Alphaproteobacteria bacterium]
MNSLISLLIWILLALGVASTPGEAWDLLQSAEFETPDCVGPAGQPDAQTQSCAATYQGHRKSGPHGPGGPQGDTDGIFNGI